MAMEGVRGSVSDETLDTIVAGINGIQLNQDIQSLTRLFFQAARQANEQHLNLYYADLKTKLPENQDPLALLSPETGRTILHELLFWNHDALFCKWLTMLTVNSVSLVDGDGETLLHTATKFGKADLVQTLLKTHSSLVNAYTKKGMTALHLAVLHKHIDIVSMFLENGLDVNQKTRESANTSLHIASLYGFNEVVDLLLKCMPVLSENSDGETAYNIAVAHQHREVAESILAYQNELTLSFFKKKYIEQLVGEDLITCHRNYLLRFPAWRPQTTLAKGVQAQDRIERIYEIGQDLGHRAAYAHPPDGLDVIVGDEFAHAKLYRSYAVYQQNGIRCYLLLPHLSCESECYVLLTGTDDEHSLHRDMTEETPGIESFQSVSHIILKSLSEMLKIHYERARMTIKLNIVGHSLGAGDGYALLIDLLLSMLNKHLHVSNIASCYDNLIEALEANVSGRNGSVLDSIWSKVNTALCSKKYTGIHFPAISRIRMTALNSVLISNSTQEKYEGILTLFKQSFPGISLENYSFMVPSDFANLSGDTYPLINISPRFLKNHFKITNIKPYALATSVGYFLAAAALNPSFSNASTGQLVAGGLIAGMTFLIWGPFAGVIACGTMVGTKLSGPLLSKGLSSMIAPHQYLPGENPEYDQYAASVTRYVSNDDEKAWSELQVALTTHEVTKFFVSLTKKSVANSMGSNSAPMLKFGPG